MLYIAVTVPQPSSPKEEQNAEKRPGVENTQPSETGQNKGQTTGIYIYISFLGFLSLH